MCVSTFLGLPEPAGVEIGLCLGIIIVGYDVMYFALRVNCNMTYILWEGG